MSVHLNTACIVALVVLKVHLNIAITVVLIVEDKSSLISVTARNVRNSGLYLTVVRAHLKLECTVTGRANGACAEGELGSHNAVNGGLLNLTVLNVGADRIYGGRKIEENPVLHTSLTCYSATAGTLNVGTGHYIGLITGSMAGDSLGSACDSVTGSVGEVLAANGTCVVSLNTVGLTSNGINLFNVLNVVNVVGNLDSVPGKHTCELNYNSLGACVSSGEGVAVKVSLIVSRNVKSVKVMAVCLKYKSLGGKGLACNEVKLACGNGNRDACKIRMRDVLAPDRNGSACSSILKEYYLRVKTNGIFTKVNVHKRALGLTGSKSNGYSALVVVVVDITVLEGDLGSTVVGEVHSYRNGIYCRGVTAVVTVLTVNVDSSGIVILEGYTAVSSRAVRSSYEKRLGTVIKNGLSSGDRGLVHVSACSTGSKTVRSLGNCHISVGNEVDNLIGINEYALGLASGTLGIKAVAANLALRSDCIAALTSTYGLVGMSNLSRGVVTTVVYTLAGVTLSIIVPDKVVRNSGNYDFITLGAVYGSRAIAVVLTCNTLRVLVSAVFTSVTINRRLVNAHSSVTDITLVVLVIIVTAGNVLPAVHTGMTPTLNVLAYGTTADVTYVVKIIVNAFGNGTAAVVTVVTAVCCNVVADLSTANVTCMVGVLVSAVAENSAANVTEVIVVIISALANLFATVCTEVAVSCALVSSYGFATDVTLVVDICVNASAEKHTAVTAGMLTCSRSVNAGDSTAIVALVVLVLIYVLGSVVNNGLGNGICSRSVRENFSTLGTYVVLIISFQSTGGLRRFDSLEHMRATGIARSES